MGAMLIDTLSLLVIEYVFMYSLRVLHLYDFIVLNLSSMGRQLHVCLPRRHSAVIKQNVLHSGHSERQSLQENVKEAKDQQQSRRGGFYPC